MIQELLLREYEQATGLHKGSQHISKRNLLPGKHLDIFMIEIGARSIHA